MSDNFVVSGSHEGRYVVEAGNGVHLTYRGLNNEGVKIHVYRIMTPGEARKLASELVEAANNVEERIGEMLSASKRS